MRSYTYTYTESFQQAKSRVAQERAQRREEDLLTAPTSEPMEGLLRVWVKLRDEVSCICI